PGPWADTLGVCCAPRRGGRRRCACSTTAIATRASSCATATRESTYSSAPGDARLGSTRPGWAGRCGAIRRAGGWARCAIRAPAAAAITAFAGRAGLLGRRCSSIVGPAADVMGLWELLRPYWGRPREIRATQPVMAISGPPQVEPDPLVRKVRPDELSILLPA